MQSNGQMPNKTEVKKLLAFNIFIDLSFMSKTYLHSFTVSTIPGDAYSLG